MRRFVLAAVVAAMLINGNPATGRTTQGGGRQLQFNVRIYVGDPLGSREAGTLKVLAEPRLVTRENRSFSFLSGGEVPVSDGAAGIEFAEFGRCIRGKPGFVKDGTVQLDLTLALTSLEQQTKTHIQLNTESTRTITTVKLGEVVKLRWGKGAADKQVWAELSVEEVQP